VTTRSVRRHRQATAELQAAIRWYENEQAGLGARFLDTIDLAVSDIVTWPNAAPQVPGWHGAPLLRTKRVPVFPYRIIYYATDTQVVIVAYAHQRRRAGYWLDRLRPDDRKSRN